MQLALLLLVVAAAQAVQADQPTAEAPSFGPGPFISKCALSAERDAAALSSE